MTTHVRVRFYGRLKERAETPVRTVELDGDAPTVGDLMARLRAGDAGLAADLEGVAVAVGDGLADAGRRLDDGDEVGLLPPVSGG